MKTPPRNQEEQFSEINPNISTQQLFQGEESMDSDKIDIDSRLNKLNELSKKNSNNEHRKSTWDSLLEVSFFIGENHENLTPKTFLIENMNLFKEKND